LKSAKKLGWRVNGEDIEHLNIQSGTQKYLTFQINMYIKEQEYAMTHN